MKKNLKHWNGYLRQASISHSQISPMGNKALAAEKEIISLPTGGVDSSKEMLLMLAELNKNIKNLNETFREHYMDENDILFDCIRRIQILTYAGTPPNQVYGLALAVGAEGVVFTYTVPKGFDLYVNKYTFWGDIDQSPMQAFGTVIAQPHEFYGLFTIFFKMNNAYLSKVVMNNDTNAVTGTFGREGTWLMSDPADESRADVGSAIIKIPETAQLDVVIRNINYAAATPNLNGPFRPLLAVYARIRGFLRPIT